MGERVWPGNLSREGPSAPLEQGSDLGPHTCLLWGALGAIRGHTTYQMLGASPPWPRHPKRLLRAEPSCSAAPGILWPAQRQGWLPGRPGSDQRPRVRFLLPQNDLFFQLYLLKKNQKQLLLWKFSKVPRSREKSMISHPTSFNTIISHSFHLFPNSSMVFLTGLLLFTHSTVSDSLRPH